MNFSTRRLGLLSLAILLLVAAPMAASRHLGILDRPAPNWEFSEWYNLPPEVKDLEIADFRGKVVYIFCFQSWCPGCHSHGFPALQEVEQHFREDEDVFFIAVQTVFEGFGTNTADRGRESLADFSLEIPLAQDAGNDGPSQFMRKYRTGGTPWTIIVDPQGVVRFNGFQIRAEQAIQLIDRLRPTPAAGTESPR